MISDKPNQENPEALGADCIITASALKERKSLFPSSPQPKRNPYANRLLELDRFAYSETAAETLSGKWRETHGYGPETRLIVEIGCNAGHVLRERAKQDLTTLFIGIDWKYKQIFRGAEKAKKADQKNAIHIRSHGNRLPQIFSAGEISELWYFFPDPWPKKGHWKHRLFTEEWLRSIHKTLQPHAKIIIRTDHAEYFQWMLRAVKTLEPEGLFHSCFLSWNTYQDHPDPKSLQIPEVTLFERLFIKDDLPIHSLTLKVEPSTTPSPKNADR